MSTVIAHTCMLLDVKRDVLLLAQYLAPEERLSAQVANETLHDIVARVAASPGTSITALALIAVTLADALEQMERGKAT